jgi:hypothetical protein
MAAAMSWALTGMGHKRGAEQAGMLDEADSAPGPPSGQMIYRGPARTSGVGRSHFVYHVRRDALLIVRVGASGTQRRAGFSRVDSSKRQHVVPARGGGCLPDVPRRLVWKSEARAIRRRFESRIVEPGCRRKRSDRPGACAPRRRLTGPGRTQRPRRERWRGAQRRRRRRPDGRRLPGRRLDGWRQRQRPGRRGRPGPRQSASIHPPGLRGIPKGQRHAGVRRRLQVGVGRVR